MARPTGSTLGTTTGGTTTGSTGTKASTGGEEPRMGACVGCGAEAGVGGSSAWSNGGGVASGEEAACVSRSSAGREGTAVRTMSSAGWTGGSVASTAGTRPASPLSRRRIRIKQSQQFAASHYLSWPADPAQVKTRRMFHVKHSVETGIVRRSALHPRSSGHNYWPPLRRPQRPLLCHFTAERRAGRLPSGAPM